jgi:hypothetical protein
MGSYDLNKRMHPEAFANEVIWIPKRLDHAPFEVGQVISAHFELESEFGTI